MEKFNQNLELFLNNIKMVVPELTQAIDDTYQFNNDTGSKYVKDFYSNIYPLRNELSNCDEVLFSVNNTILQNINFNTLWNNELVTQNVQKTIWKYLHTLYLFSYEYSNKIILTDTLKHLKKLSKEDKLDNITSDELILINIINKLSDEKSEVIKTLHIDNTENSNSLENMIPPEIFNGAIGNLAQEIAQEIDPSSLNLDDPSKLIKNLLSGNMDEDNGISSLVRKISGKIQSKIENGSLNQDTMMNEAQNVMKSLSNNGSMGDLSNLMSGAGGIPNLEGLMDGMTDLMAGEDGQMPDLNNLFSGLMNKSNMNKSALKIAQDKSARKKQLRDKLKRKKELLKQQEVLLSTQSMTPNFIEKDLDTLVKEIEAVGEILPVKKKKKKRKKKSKKETQLKSL